MSECEHCLDILKCSRALFTKAFLVFFHSLKNKPKLHEHAVPYHLTFQLHFQAGALTIVPLS